MNKQERQLYKLWEFIVKSVWFVIKLLLKLIVFLLTSFCELFWSWESKSWVHVCRWVILLIVFILWMVWYNYREEIINWTLQWIICIRSPSKCVKREYREEQRENYSTWKLVNEN